MTSYNLEVEVFISEVKKYPEIWNLHSEDNRSMIKKQQAWSEIARTFITDFDDMPDLEKNDVYCKLYGKWRNIRDAYVRHCKRKYGKKGYVYAKHLTFLDVLYKQNSQSESDGECDNVENNVDLKHKLEYKQGLNLLNDTSVWINECDTEDLQPLDTLRRKKYSTKETDIEYVAGSSYGGPPVEDEDRSFFESLLPVVREFDMDQKLEFRSDVLSLIKTIRSNGRKKFKLDPTTGTFD